MKKRDNGHWEVMLDKFKKIEDLITKLHVCDDEGNTAVLMELRMLLSTMTHIDTMQIGDIMDIKARSIAQARKADNVVVLSKFRKAS